MPVSGPRSIAILPCLTPLRPAVHSKRGSQVCEASVAAPPKPPCRGLARPPRSPPVPPRERQHPAARQPSSTTNRTERDAMGKALGLVGAIVVIAIALLVWGTGVNNRLVASDQNVNEKWSQVQNVYQRRSDLIPNLVETVKGFAAQERQVL